MIPSYMIYRTAIETAELMSYCITVDTVKLTIRTVFILWLVPHLSQTYV